MRNSSQLTNISGKSAAFLSDLKALVEDMEKIQSIAHSLGDASIAKPSSIHDGSGNLLWRNDAMAELVGFNGEVGSKGILESVHVQDRVLVAHYLADDATSPTIAKPTAEFRTILHGAQKPSAEWIEVSSHIVHGKRSLENLKIVTYRDISLSKQNELALAKSQAEAEKASTAKSQFLANISHELRTPLNAILGFSELLNSSVVSNFSEEKRSEYIGLIHDSASHLLTLLNGILDMSKIENGMYEIFPESFCLSKCLENTTAIMRGQAAGHQIELVPVGIEEMPDIVADERAVKQILINLLSNAIKFSHDHGKVFVKAERRARTVSISIVDEGVGISAENLANLGKPFFQADSKYDRKYEGTGLGLSVVKGLVELHGGQVRFQSTRGNGTTVVVTLPIHGRVGRQVPAGPGIEKITSIRPDSRPEVPMPKIVQKLA